MSCLLLVCINPLPYKWPHFHVVTGQNFKISLIEWLIDLWPILHLVLVLQEVQDLLSLLWSHCIHLGLENQYHHLDLGDPDTQAHVISLTSDPLLAGLINTFEWQPKKYLTGTPSMPGKPGTPTLPWNQTRSKIFPNDWWVNHDTSSSGALKNNQNQMYLHDLLCVQQPLPGPHLLFGLFLPRAPEGLENQEALVDPAIPENQEGPWVKKCN